MTGLTAALRRILPYTSILCLIAAIYSGTILYLRWRSAREMEDAARRVQAQRDRLVLSANGTGVKILAFYASPPSIHRGEKTLLCYGVGNARKVTLDPPVDDVWPASSRCMEVSPKATTTYKITATDENGKSVEQSAEIEVR